MYELYDCARPTHLWGVWMVPICTYGVFIEDEESGSNVKVSRVHVSERTLPFLTTYTVV